MFCRCVLCFVGVYLYLRGNGVVYSKCVTDCLQNMLKYIIHVFILVHVYCKEVIFSLCFLFL